MVITKEILSDAYDTKIMPRGLINHRCALCNIKSEFIYGLTTDDGVIPICYDCDKDNSKKELVQILMIEYTRLLMGLRR